MSLEMFYPRCVCLVRVHKPACLAADAGDVESLKMASVQARTCEIAKLRELCLESRECDILAGYCTVSPTPRFRSECYYFKNFLIRKHVEHAAKGPVMVSPDGVL